MAPRIIHDISYHTPSPLISLPFAHSSTEKEKGVDLEAIQDPPTRDGMQPCDKTTLL